MSPLVMRVGTHQEIFSILKSVLGNIIYKDDDAEGQSQFISVNQDISGKYQAGFFDRCVRAWRVNPSYQERYNNLDRYLETLAKITSGGHTFDAGTIDWKTHQLYVDIIKAAATLELNRRRLFPPPRTRSLNVPENAEEYLTKMPGSWPA
jgi:hypothetical protein